MTNRLSLSDVQDQCRGLKVGTRRIFFLNHPLFKNQQNALISNLNSDRKGTAVSILRLDDMTRIEVRAFRLYKSDTQQPRVFKTKKKAKRR